MLVVSQSRIIVCFDESGCFVCFHNSALRHVLTFPQGCVVNVSVRHGTSVDELITYSGYNSWVKTKLNRHDDNVVM